MTSPGFDYVILLTADTLNDLILLFCVELYDDWVILQFRKKAAPWRILSSYESRLKTPLPFMKFE